MKKNIGFISGIVCLGIVICVVWYCAKVANILKDIDVTTIVKIEIWSNDTPTVLENKEDINEVMDTLQSTSLKKSSGELKAGGLMVDIYLKDGEEISITVLSDAIYMEDNVYKSDIDCTKTLRKYIK